jgi:hypothetical protein
LRLFRPLLPSRVSIAVLFAFRFERDTRDDFMKAHPSVENALAWGTAEQRKERNNCTRVIYDLVLLRKEIKSSRDLTKQHKEEMARAELKRENVLKK